MMPKLGDFEAWVEVDDARLDEYRVEFDRNGLVARCWISSEEGKNFVVYWKAHTRTTDLRGRIYVDGQFADGPVMKLGKPNVRPSAGRYVKERAYTLNRFGAMKLTGMKILEAAKYMILQNSLDDESCVVQDESTLKALGTIELVIHRGTADQPTSFGSGVKALDERPVYEKLKKAGGHRVIAGAVVRQTSNWFKFKEDSSSPTKFVFQYRPKEILQALEIIPRDRTNTTHVNSASLKREVESDGDDDDEDEEDEEPDPENDIKIRYLKEQLAALSGSKKKKGKKPAVKQESSGRPEKRVKREEINAARFFARGEIIDLT